MYIQKIHFLQSEENIKSTNNEKIYIGNRKFSNITQFSLTASLNIKSYSYKVKSINMLFLKYLNFYFLSDNIYLTIECLLSSLYLAFLI